MSIRAATVFPVVTAPIVLFTICLQVAARPQTSVSSSSSSRGHNSQIHAAEQTLDLGSVNAGVYRNPSFAFTCKLPAGWILRTEEMNAKDQDDAHPADKELDPKSSSVGSTPDSHVGGAAPGCPVGRSETSCGRVLLAAFSRPPEARAEDVNASILIAAESARAYPGLKDAAQYFGPLTEVAKAQRFEIDGEPYEFAIGTKMLVRGDFQKDVGSRVMRQSTLVMLAQGYAISFTFIGGTEDQVEELVSDLAFGTSPKPVK
jgi:hypothetical protein